MSQYEASEKARTWVGATRALERSVRRANQGYCSQCTAEPAAFDSLLTFNGEAERPHTAARRTPRAHTVLQRPRRVTTGVSRTPPTIVRHLSAVHL
jgi:hypothetical protein